MSALTAPRNTRELLGPMSYERTAGATIHAGALVAQNGSGYAVPASDAAGLTVLGRAENSAASGEKVVIRSGVYLYDNGASGEALAVTDIGSPAYALDDHTVGKAGGTYQIPAGVVLDVTADGVAVLVAPDALARIAAATESASGSGSN